MKNKISNRIFIIFSLCILVVGLIAFKSLAVVSNQANIAKTSAPETNKALDPACYVKSSDPYVTIVNPNCK